MAHSTPFLGWTKPKEVAHCMLGVVVLERATPAPRLVLFLLMSRLGVLNIDLERSPVPFRIAKKAECCLLHVLFTLLLFPHSHFHWILNYIPISRLIQNAASEISI